ncbi:response regulator [Kineococcus rhizosphaerae]|uniref:LuxR family two component transcriptional regulator n=1 Tax=Kineococcus rhizosphaerae TaxID=559628 RepID=A0A2T0R0J2_9ACTN|nr:response regulator transcription factor [Kineococcus rhizosphaerae]PRY12588.1 LuxR family two component transcriptional regulator [Kineococcus rhizosphaerae]
MDQVIRVLVVDDHRLVRAGLVALLSAEEDLVVVGEASDGAEAVDVATATAPDVVLMDLSMPGVDGVSATAAVLAVLPSTAVVVLTSFIDQAQVRRALDAGAVGYLLKDAEPRDVLAGVRAAAAGHAPLDPRVTRALLPSRRAQDPAAGLSEREREVLGLVAQGLANKQIARTLGISEHTVKVHVGKVLRVLGVSGRTAAAVWARENL